MTHKTCVPMRGLGEWRAVIWARFLDAETFAEVDSGVLGWFAGLGEYFVGGAGVDAKVDGLETIKADGVHGWGLVESGDPWVMRVVDFPLAGQ